MFMNPKVLVCLLNNAMGELEESCDGFHPSTSCLWNSLPSSVFPASSNFSSLKRQVDHHLRNQIMIFFFFFFFFYHFYSTF